MNKVKKVLSLLLSLCMAMNILCVTASVPITERPDDGTTTGQPFASGTGGSDNFRIPGIVTLDNGTLIATCDARWNHYGDGAGLDTIVSVSTDNGATWNYTFANYLGDNGNTYNNLSTCFIDPAIATDGERAYVVADLFPAGIALNTSKYSPVAGENGFDEDGNLRLRLLADDTVAIGDSSYNTMAAFASYDYYLDLIDYCIYDYATGTKVEGYTVDKFFNITGNGVDTNLFIADSPYQVYPTNYLYLISSTDGLNWSEPTLLNLQEDEEQTLLVGPGNGTYATKNGHLIFTAYEYTSGYQRTSLLYSTDGGKTWARTDDATVFDWSSEASAVELPDGTIRCFYRDEFDVLRYTDYTWDGSAYTPGPEVSTTATKTYNNQLSAIRYSQQIGGKDVILVSTANGSGNSRTNGYIYLFTLNPDNTMELSYAYNVTPGDYAYSCITELENGDLGLLYEHSGSKIQFVTISVDDIVTRDNEVALTAQLTEEPTTGNASFILPILGLILGLMLVFAVALFLLRKYKSKYSD